jgi:peptidoglycan/xylan/chitin deacetylase (PgdA/CDA1 family)
MSAFSRALVPAVALGVGTWLGMGRPDAQTAFAAGTRAIASVAGAAHELAPRLPPAPPLEKGPATVDPSSLPDPAPPWPRLNPEQTAERAWLLAEGPARPPDIGRRLVTFTFDDGPFPETAPTVLHILDLHRVRATFFFIGKYLEGDSEHAVETRQWARRIADAGHFIGNHTRDHKDLTSLPRSAALAEIDDSAADIERASGRRPILFRPPYGLMDPFLEGALRERHLELTLWSIDVEDMKRSDPDAMVSALLHQLEYKGGGVVLLHDMHWPSVQALNRLLHVMANNRWDSTHPERAGWAIVDLPDYLHETEARPQPYANREELEKARKAANELRVPVTAR